MNSVTIYLPDFPISAVIMGTVAIFAVWTMIKSVFRVMK